MLIILCFIVSHLSWNRVNVRQADEKWKIVAEALDDLFQLISGEARKCSRARVCVSAFVEARATEITFDFSIMASFRLVPGPHQHPLEFSVFLYRFLIYVPVIRGATYVVLQLTGKISLLNTDVVLLLVLSFSKREPKANEAT